MKGHAEIAGAGFAGLTAAIALLQRGWTARVHERSSTLRSEGLGIAIQQNGLRTLQALGLNEVALRGSIKIQRRVICDSAGRIAADLGISKHQMRISRRLLIQEMASKISELVVKSSPIPKLSGRRLPVSCYSKRGSEQRQTSNWSLIKWDRCKTIMLPTWSVGTVAVVAQCSFCGGRAIAMAAIPIAKGSAPPTLWMARIVQWRLTRRLATSLKFYPTVSPSVVAEASMETKRIGLIIPPADGTTPRECRELYSHVEFSTVGIGIKEMSSDGFEAAEERIFACARTLKTFGVSAISVMGTSLTFYKGSDYNDDLITRVSAETQLPVTTMSSAIVKALKANGVKRVAVATAYTPDLNVGLATFLEHHGIRTAGMVGLGIKDIDSVRPISARLVGEAAEAAFKQDPTVDGILISCGGLPTVPLHVPLEAKLGVPVVSSLAAGLWDVVQMVDVDPRTRGFGKMFAADPCQAALSDNEAK